MSKLERLRREVRRLREDLAAARRGRDDVLEIMAHDLRGPIGSIRVYAESLLLGPTPPEASPTHTTDGLTAVRRTAERALWLIEDLLDFAALESGRLPIVAVPSSVAAVVNAVVQTLARSAGERRVTIETHLAATDLLVRADGERLVQALTNLVSHAVQVSRDGGTVAVAAEAQDPGVTFLVEYAAGLGPEDLARIFDHQWGGAIRRYHDAGLRLSIAKRIVEAHGGSMHVESAEGGATRLSFTLPPAPP